MIQDRAKQRIIEVSAIQKFGYRAANNKLVSAGTITRIFMSEFKATDKVRTAEIYINLLKLFGGPEINYLDYFKSCELFLCFLAVFDEETNQAIIKELSNA